MTSAMLYRMSCLPTHRQWPGARHLQWPTWQTVFERPAVPDTGHTSLLEHSRLRPGRSPVTAGGKQGRYRDSNPRPQDQKFVALTTRPPRPPSPKPRRSAVWQEGKRKRGVRCCWYDGKRAT
ncbi:hypothetical protein ACOMHN_002960 [Nucella lapillus]